MSNTIILGIDPGVGGGIAIFYPDGKKEALAFDKVLTYVDIFENIKNVAKEHGWDTFAVLELLTGFQQQRVKMPGALSFKMGENYGKIQGWLESFKIPFEKVTPAKWQIGLTGVKAEKDYSKKKRLLCLLAKQQFPDVKPTMKTCDAILIAKYASTLKN